MKIAPANLHPGRRKAGMEEVVQKAASSASRELEHPHGAALLEEVHAFGDVAAPQRHRAPPAGHYRNVLHTIVVPRDRRGDDAGTSLELPELLAGLGVRSLEIPLGRSPEHEAAC